MKNKEVINIKNGNCLGCVNDVEVDTSSAKLVSIIIYGRLKFFGLLGRHEDIIIRWEDIEVIGKDTILVCNSNFGKFKKRRNGLSWLFK